MIGRYATVCHSNAGYYIGVVDNNGMPFTRCSGYFKREDAYEYYNNNTFFDCIYSGKVYSKPPIALRDKDDDTPVIGGRYSDEEGDW